MRRLLFSVRFQGLVFLCCLAIPAQAAGPSQDKADKPVEHWLAQLQSVNAEEREAAAYELGRRLGSRLSPPSFKDSLTPEEKATIVSRLLQALEDQHPFVRRQAALSLGSLESGEKRVLAALQKAAKDSEARVRVAAHGALWRITDEEASLIPILAALKDKAPDVRLDAVWALRLGRDNKKSIAPLLPLLKDSDAQVRRQTGDVMNRLCGVLRGEAKEAVPALVELLGSDDAHLRWCARGALGGIGPEAKAALPALVEALNKGENTAWAIGQIGSDGKTVVHALVKALSDKEKGVRMEAAYALGTIGAEGKPAASALQKATEDKDMNVRMAARLALWRATGEEKQVRLAFTEAAEEKSNALINGAAWLGSLGSPGVRVLVDNLKHPAAKVREAAALSLGTIDPPAKQAVPALIQVLQDPDPEVRKSAASALRAIDPEAAKKAGVK